MYKRDHIELHLVGTAGVVADIVGSVVAIVVRVRGAVVAIVGSAVPSRSRSVVRGRGVNSIRGSVISSRSVVVPLVRGDRLSSSGVCGRVVGGNIVVVGLVGTGLDDNGFDLLCDNGAGRATVLVIVGRVGVVGSNVLAAFSSPAPDQKTGKGQGGQASEDNTGNGASRQLLLSLRLDGNGGPGGALDGGGRAGRTNDGRGTDGGAGDRGDTGSGAADDAGGTRDPGGGAVDSGAVVDDGGAHPAGGARDDGVGAAVVGGAVIDASDNSRCGAGGGGGDGTEDLGALAGSVLVGATVGVAQGRETAASNKALELAECCVVHV